MNNASFWFLVGLVFGGWLDSTVPKEHFDKLEREHLMLQVDCSDAKEAYWRDIDECKQQGCKL
jgi:hypothetical protein